MPVFLLSFLLAILLSCCLESCPSFMLSSSTASVLSSWTSWKLTRQTSSFPAFIQAFSSRLTDRPFCDTSLKLYITMAHWRSDIPSRWRPCTLACCMSDILPQCHYGLFSFMLSRMPDSHKPINLTQCYECLLAWKTACLLALRSSFLLSCCPSFMLACIQSMKPIVHYYLQAWMPYCLQERPQAFGLSVLLSIYHSWCVSCWQTCWLSCLRTCSSTNPWRDNR